MFCASILSGIIVLFPKVNKIDAHCKWLLSHEVASVSDITPCNKIDKPLVVEGLIETEGPRV